MERIISKVLLLLIIVFALGCTTLKQVHFPAPEEMFITTGDGDIAKPYEPVGRLVYKKQGFRIPLPILGFIPLVEAEPTNEIQGIITEKAKSMGGDAIINLDIDWTPSTSGFLGLGAKGGLLSIEGTVIRQFGDVGPFETASQPSLVTTSSQQDNWFHPMFQGAIDGLNFALSYSRGTNNEFGIGSNESTGGYSGLRLKFSLKHKDALYYFYPEISYANLSKEFKEFGGFERSIRTIPITFNVGVNGSQIKKLAQNISPSFNPYANFGLGYYITEFDGDNWEWTEFGYNFGLGVEYRFQPNLSIGGGFNRHSVFTGETYTYWDWSLGLSYFLNR